jgi:hypothetical protein
VVGERRAISGAFGQVSIFSSLAVGRPYDWWRRRWTWGPSFVSEITGEKIKLIYAAQLLFL